MLAGLVTTAFGGVALATVAIRWALREREGRIAAEGRTEMLADAMRRRVEVDGELVTMDSIEGRR